MIFGNNIYGNSTTQLELNQYAASNPAVVSATGNWWGTPTPVVGTQIRVSGGTLSSAPNFSSPASGLISSDAQAPTPPDVVQITGVRDSQITLVWSGATDNVGVVRYRVERCMGDGCGDFAQIAIVLTSTHLDTGLVRDTRYRYRVRSEDAIGNLSPYSVVVDDVTVLDSEPPDAPANLVAGRVSRHSD